MAIFALIKDAVTVLETRNLPSQPADVPSKGLTWLPFVESYPPFNPLTETRNPATTTIEAARVFRTATVRLLTAQELADRKDEEVNGIHTVIFEVAFNHENRIRALEGQGSITRVQFKNGIKALLP